MFVSSPPIQEATSVSICLICNSNIIPANVLTQLLTIGEVTKHSFESLQVGSQTCVYVYWIQTSEDLRSCGRTLGKQSARSVIVVPPALTDGAIQLFENHPGMTLIWEDRLQLLIPVIRRLVVTLRQVPSLPTPEYLRPISPPLPNLQESRLKALTSVIPDTWFRISREGKYLDFGTPSPELLALSPETLIGSTIDDLPISPELKQRFKTVVDQAFQTRHLQTLEYEMDVPAGRRYFELRALASSDTEAILIVRDQTDARHSAETIRISEERLRFALEGAQIGTWHWDIVTNEMEWSDRYYAIFGLSHDLKPSLELWEGMLHPDDHDWVIQALGTMLDHENESSAEYRILRPDGSVRWVNVVGRLGRQPDGSPLQMEGIIFDITDRQLAQEKIRQSEEWFRTLVQHSSDIVAVIQPDGTRRFVSSGARRVLGYAPEELIGKNAFQGVHPEDMARVEQSFRTVLTEPSQTVQIEFRFQHLTGHWVDLELIGENYLEIGGVEGVVVNIRDITARKKAQALLRRSEEKFAQIFHDSPMAICIISLQTAEILDVNQAFLDISDYARQDLLHQTPADVGLWRSMRGVERLREKLVASGGLLSFTAELRRRTGEIRIVEGRSTLMEFPEELCALTIFVDTTERFRMEQALRVNQERLTETGRLARVGGWEVNLGAERVYWTEEVFLIHDMQPGLQPTREEAFGFYPPDAQSVLHVAVERTIQTGIPWELELPLITATGRQIWVHSLGHVEYREGQPYRLHGAVQDVTERHLREERMRLLESAIEHANDAVFITEAEPIDPPGPPIVYVNQAFVDVTGFESSEVIGLTPSILKSPRTRLEDLERSLEALHRREPITFENITSRKDGSEFWGEISIFPVIDVTGKHTHWVAILRDITERHVIEDRLRQSQRMETLGQFSSGVAHNFNNLLTVIRGYADMLARLFKTEPSTLEMALEIRRAADRGAELVRELMAFGRRTEANRAIIDVNEVVLETTSLMQRLIGPHIQVDLDLDESCPHICADASQLTQVLLNLAANARDAMPTGGTLAIQTRLVSVDEQALSELIDRPGKMVVSTNPITTGKKVKVTVRDIGTGIPPEVLKRIFEPFFTTKDIGKGTGLGLATVYGFVNGSGGFIEVSSRPEYGTTFHIYLPSADQETLIGIDYDPLLPNFEVGTQTVLVVDDEPAVRKMVKELLHQNGFHLLEAGSGEEALALERSYKGTIDLILSDLLMPKMNGYELVARFLTRRPTARALLMTGDGSRITAENEHTLLPLLAKPFTEDQLLAAVRRSLTGKHIRMT
ncbi:MAG: PAS domain S-box protein [Acidobacteria bacterium]|nr:PAS domain S-box protein [Acidobacteriota bacterium]